ncbi:MAG: cysteine desulfurase [Clostridia bacterium]|nr:cysteine desulfurase [Clostridia bacterium]
MVYLDNAATTKPSKAAVDAMLVSCEHFGNPSSLHRVGLNAEKIIKNSRQAVSRLIGVDAGKIYFTSGGTEANNMAILGCAFQNEKKGRHLVTTKIEHPSVLEVFKFLEKAGFEVSFVGVDQNGIMRIDEFEAVLREDTVLVSVMSVNNETGMIQPVDKLKAIMGRKSPKAALHSDAVQAFGKIVINPRAWGINLLSMSAHKVHGIKGTGALYADGVSIRPLFAGGGQEKNMRSGTENVVGIAAFGAVAGEIDITKNREKALLLRKRLEQGILSNIDDVKINGSDEFASGFILNVSFLGVKSEVLLHSLENRGIYVSSGSACSSNKSAQNYVLAAMGRSKEEIDGAIRFSLSNENTDGDIDFCIDVLKTEVANIRKYVRGRNERNHHG